MRIVCDSCGTKYSISDEKVRGKLFKIRCKKCSHVIVVRGIQAGMEAEGEVPEVKKGQQYAQPEGGIGDSAAAAESEWFFVLDGQQAGPIDVAQIEAHLTSGQITADTYVWRDGMDNWLHLSEIPELAHLVAIEASASYLAAEPPEKGEAEGRWAFPAPAQGPLSVSPFAPSLEPTGQLYPMASESQSGQPAGSLPPTGYFPETAGSRSDLASSLGQLAGGTDYADEDAITVVAKTQIPYQTEEEYAESVFQGAGAAGMEMDSYPEEPFPGGERPGLDGEPSFSDRTTDQYGSETAPPMRFSQAADQDLFAGLVAPPSNRGPGGALKITPTSLVGARHEDSVLFSLDSLSRSTSKLVQRGTKEGRPGEGSGLIDIRALAAREPAADEVSSVPSAEHFVPAVMPLGRRQSNKLLYGLIAFGIVVIAGLAAAIIVVLTQDRTAGVPGQQQPVTVAAVPASEQGVPTVSQGTGEVAPVQTAAIIAEAPQPTSSQEQLQAAAAAATTAAGVAIKAQQTIPLVVEAVNRQQALAQAQREQPRDRTRETTTTPSQQTGQDRTRRTQDRTTEVSRRTDDRESTQSRGGDAVDDALQRIRGRSTPSSDSRETPQPEEQEEPEEEETETATSDQLPERLTTSAVRQTIRRYSRRLADCRREANIPDGEVLRVDVSMTVHGTGRVASASGDSSSPGAQCVVSVVRDMRFPEFSGEPMAFTYPFRIR